MTDRSNGILHVGGTVRSIDLPQMAAILVQAGAGLEYDKPFESADQAAAALVAAADARRVFMVCGSDLTGGCFAGVPDQLQEQGLHYIASWEGHHAYSPGVERWSPCRGLDQMPATADGRPLIGLQDLQRAVAAHAMQPLLLRLRLFYPDSLPPIVIDYSAEDDSHV